MKALIAPLCSFALISTPAMGRQLESGTVETESGIRLFYERLGNGPEYVIVPGRFLFNGDVAKLAHPSRSLIFYDMRNRGRSSAVADDDQISIHADVRDLEDVRRHFGAEEVRLIGYSYLGLMTALYALQHPDRVERLVQIGPVPIRVGADFPKDLVWSDPVPVVPPEKIAELRSLRDQGFDRAQPQEFCRQWETLTRVRLVANPANADKVDTERRCSMRNEWPVNLTRHLQIHFAGSVQKLQVSDQMLDRLQAPVLVLHGTMDRNSPLAAGAEWAMKLPNARLLIVPEAAHPVWLDRPAVLETVDTFLSGDWPPKAAIVKDWSDVRASLPRGLAEQP